MLNQHLLLPIAREVRKAHLLLIVHSFPSSKEGCSSLAIRKTSSTRESTEREATLLLLVLGVGCNYVFLTVEWCASGKAVVVSRDVDVDPVSRTFNHQQYISSCLLLLLLLRGTILSLPMRWLFAVLMFSILLSS
jgi:hypothetical protein